MLPEFKRKTNIGVGLGLLVQVAGKLLQSATNPTLIVLGAIVVLLGFGLFIWGCAQYARGKGWSPYYGALGLLWLLGLIILALLPDRHRGAPDGTAPSRQITVTDIGKNGFTEFMYAAAEGDAARITTLLATGSSVNAADDQGKTCLMYAAMNGHREVVQLLIQHGADPDLTTKVGRTAAWFAKRRGFNDVLRTLGVPTEHPN